MAKPRPTATIPTGQFLTSFTNAYGTTNYTYVTGQSAAQNNALATITKAAGTELFYGYDSDGRLIDQHENGGAEDETISYLSPAGYVTDRCRRQPDHRLLQPLWRSGSDHRPPGQRHPLLL